MRNLCSNYLFCFAMIAVMARIEAFRGFKRAPAPVVMIRSPVPVYKQPVRCSSVLRMAFTFGSNPVEAIVSASLPVQGFVLNFLLVTLLKCMGTKSLTDSGLFHSYLLGWGLWSTLGLAGWSYGVAYFVLGVAVTKVKMAEKESLGIAEKRGGKRGPENVWGSAGTAMLCALATLNAPSGDWTSLFKIGFVASLATKLSDTFGSEVGKAYGKTCYLITNFAPVPRGTEGAVSLEGTFAGVVASVIMAFVSVALGLVSGSSAATAIIVASFVATALESFIGAKFQDNVSWLTNELVNFINTLIGAAVAIVLVMLTWQ